MTNVVTLTLSARLHPDAEPERTVWWVHEPSPGALDPIPAICLLPLWQVTSGLVRDLRSRLGADRESRGLRPFDEEGVGVLDADDVAWLQQEAALVCSTDSGLLAIRTVLDTLVEIQPGLVVVAEQWRDWLNLVSDAWAPGSRFELDLGGLFGVGDVFERTTSFRLFDQTRFLASCSGASGAEGLRADMGMLLLEHGFSESTDDPAAIRLAKLRQHVTFNRLDDFLAEADLSEPAHARLFMPAFGAALAAGDGSRKELIIRRAEVGATVALAEVRLRCLGEAGEVAHELRSDGEAERAAQLYTDLLRWYQADLTEENQFTGEWLRILSNLSYLQIEKLDQPQAALDLLLPAVRAVDSRPAGPSRLEEESSDSLARVRANLDAAVYRLQSRGVSTPPGIGTPLSTADRARLDTADDDFIAAMELPDPARAVTIADWALRYLNEREVEPTRPLYVEWMIDRARAVRDLGGLEEAAVILRQQVELCRSALAMNLRSRGGRASIALAITYRRMDRPAEEIATYREFIDSPQARESARTNQLNVRRAHANLAAALEREGDQAAAAAEYLAAARVDDRLGQAEERGEALRKAAAAARLAGDKDLENSILGDLGEGSDPERQQKPDGPLRRLAERGLLGWWRDR